MAKNRRNPKAKWVLPVVVRPATFTSWCVPVPDDRQHRAAFLGALLNLCSAMNWADDTSHTAKDAAKVWQEIYDNLVKCLDETPVLEMEYDMSICEQLRVNNGVLEGLCCGVWEKIPVIGTTAPPSATQPPASGNQALGTCKEYDVILPANGQWIFPMPVQGGTVITISGAAGGWNDGGTAWYCPDGTPYVLGGCVGAGGLHGGDPAPAVDHMRLILKAGTSAWQDAYNTIITIPSGQPSQDAILQANDDTLADNRGSISLHIKVCAPDTATWCALFDATNGWAGWAGITQFGCAPALVGGVWEGCLNTFPYVGNEIQASGLVLPTGSAVTKIETTINTNNADPQSQRIEIDATGGAHVDQGYTGTGTSVVNVMSGIAVSGTVSITVLNNNNPGHTPEIFSVKISGAGTPPSWATGQPC